MPVSCMLLVGSRLGCSRVARIKRADRTRDLYTATCNVLLLIVWKLVKQVALNKQNRT